MRCLTCLTSRPHQTVPGSVCVWWCLVSVVWCCCCRLCCCRRPLWWSVCRWTCDRGYRWLTPLVCPLFNVNVLTPFLRRMVATCVFPGPRSLPRQRDRGRDPCAYLYIKSPLVCLCTSTRHSTHTLLPPCSFEDTMKLNSEKVELQPGPRPTLSLVSTSPRVSELEDASSTREGDADEFSLVQLHHRLELECLPPVDQGKHAYLFLLACFILEALIWGKSIPIPAFPRLPPSSPLPDRIRQDVSVRIPSHPRSSRKRA